MHLAFSRKARFKRIHRPGDRLGFTQSGLLRPPGPSASSAPEASKMTPSQPEGRITFSSTPPDPVSSCPGVFAERSEAGSEG